MDADDQAEIDAMDEPTLRDAVRVAWTLNEDRDRLLAAIPQCPDHGECLPYAMAWIAKAVAAGVKLEDGEVPRLTLEQSAAIDAAFAKIASR